MGRPLGAPNTLELTQCAVCNLEAFHRLTAHLTAHLPRFWEVYNAALADYRRRHHIRSSAHPVPELGADGKWLEAPFWIWTNDDPRRRRVFVGPRGDELILTDRAGLEIPLRLAPDSDTSAAVEQLAGLAERGIHLRSRALLTTLAARLLLGDLFIHGIGGAKYDRLTDDIIQRFFCLAPPAYMVVSGTLHLPIDHQPTSADELRGVERRLRDLTFHPERFVADDGGAAAQNGDSPAHWTAEKRRWIATAATRAAARERCRAIRAANEQLQPWVADERACCERGARYGAGRRPCGGEAILTSREYGFCLHPEQSLRKFLLEFLGETT